MSWVIVDNRDGSNERVVVRRHVVREGDQVAFRCATEEARRRNLREGWDRFVVVRAEVLR